MFKPLTAATEIFIPQFLNNVWFQKISIPSPLRATEIPRGRGSKKRQFPRGWGWLFEVLFFRGLQVRLASYCSSAVAHRKLLAKKELYEGKLSLLGHKLT